MSSRDDDHAPRALAGVRDPLEDRQAADPHTERPGPSVPDPAPTPPNEPAPGGTVLSRPRTLLLVPYVVLTLGLAFMAVAGNGGVGDLADLDRGRVGFAAGAVLFGILTWQVLQHRIVLQGRFLHHRAAAWRPPVDLDRLASAGIERIAMGGRRAMGVRAPILVLRDLDDRSVMIDRVSGDVEPLYRELARRFDAGDPVIDGSIAARVDRLREPPTD